MLLLYSPNVLLSLNVLSGANMSFSLFMCPVFVGEVFELGITRR